MENISFKRAEEEVKNKKVGVIPTDTLYGVVGTALSEEVVERIYKIKERSADKPLIVLIGDLADLKLFNIKTSVDLNKFWPGKVSIILPCEEEKFTYLHRGKKTLAFRLTDDKRLRLFLKEVGPLVAPSANKEGENPSKNIKEAKSYFNNEVDFYIDGGELLSKPSTLISIENNKVFLHRKGAVDIEKNLS